MNKIQDLHIEKEILPLFNYSSKQGRKKNCNFDLLNQPI